MNNAMNTWQPIETAPKNGTTVLLFTPYRHIDSDPTSGIRTGFWCKYDQLWDRDYSSKRMAKAEAPTHWMPLPSAPMAPVVETKTFTIPGIPGTFTED